METYVAKLLTVSIIFAVLVSCVCANFNLYRVKWANLLLGTICCMYGCCPTGSVCNAVGGCDSPSGGNPGNTSPLPPPPSSPGKSCPSSLTSHTTVTEFRTVTDFVTSTLSESCSSGPVSGSSSPHSHSSAFSQTQRSPTTSDFSQTKPSTTTSDFSQSKPSTSKGGFSQTSPSGTAPGGGHGGAPTTWTEPDGQTVISSSGVSIIGTNPPVTLPTVSSPTTLTTDGETFTLRPTPSEGGTSAPAGPTTWTEPDGQTVISSSGVVIIGTNPPVTLPTVSSLSTFITDGETFTLSPPPRTGTSGPSGPSGPGNPGGRPTTWTEPDGQTVISSSGVVIIGTNPPVTLPTVSSLSTFVTDGETFTLSPRPSGSGTAPGQRPTTFTEPDGQTVISSSGVVIIGTNPPVTLPTVSSLSTFTTDGETFTLRPPQTTTSGQPGPTTTAREPITFTEPDGQTVISSSGVVIIGTHPPVTLPTVSSPTTLITDGETFTLRPPLPETTLPSGATHQSSTGVGPVTTFSTWPPNAIITPVTTDVDEPHQTDDGSVTPCDLWFFFVSTSTP